MRLFFSDPHFHHGAILAHAGRPFPTVEAMNAALVERYQERVGIADVVYWLGDCAFGGRDRLRSILDALPGYKILVPGNHDKGPSAMAACGFDLVVPGTAVLEIAGHPAELSHYPYRDGLRAGDTRVFTFPTRKQGYVLLHGHTHSRRRRNGSMIHVGVDAWDFAPVREGEIDVLVREVFGEA